MNRICLRLCFFINDQYHANSFEKLSGQTSESRCEGFFCFYQTSSNTLKKVMESAPEASGKLHILTRLSVRENMIEFCRPRAFEDVFVAWPNALSWHLGNFDVLMLSRINKCIKERIMMGNRAYYANRQLVNSSLITRNSKLQIYRTSVRPVISCG